MKTRSLGGAVVILAALAAMGGCKTTDGETEEASESALESAAARRFEPRGEDAELARCKEAKVPNTTCNGFSLANAAWLSRASNVVYENRAKHAGLEEKLKYAVSRLGGDPIQITAYRFFDAKDDTQAAYVSTDRVAILAFRGTESEFDIKRDLEFRKVPVGGGKVHSGFFKSFQAVWNADSQLKNMKEDERGGLLDFLKAEYAKHPNVPLYVTGHSLGAGMATLAVNSLLDEKVPVQALYTFGSPRVGNPDFADQMARKTLAANTHVYRVINHGDGVTVVPPVWVLDYKHISLKDEDEEQNFRTVFLSKDPEKRQPFIGDTFGEHDWKDRIRAYWASFKAGSPIHHPIPYYICKLDRAIDPGAPCVEKVAREANVLCTKAAEALADVAARHQEHGGCGQSRDEAISQYSAALRCSAVTGVKDRARFEDKCLKEFRSRTCDQLSGETAFSPECTAQLEYLPEGEQAP